MGYCAKLVPRFFGTFQVLERVWSMTYRFALPPSIKVHNFFHVSLLKKYVQDVNYVIDWLVLQVELEREF